MLAVLAFFKTKAGITVLVALAVAVFCISLVAYGASQERKREEARDAIAVAEAQALDTKADQKSEAQLTAEAQAIAAKKERLEDEVAKVADGPVSASDVVYGCRELQRHGISTADLPACRSVGG